MGAEIVAAIIAAVAAIAAAGVGASSAKKNREFQKKMSDTAHQREVADLEKAGINPILSYGGSGASTPPGATYSMQAPLQNIVSDVSSAKAKKQEIEKSKTEQGHIEQLKKTAKSQEKLNSATANREQSQVNLNRKLLDKVGADTEASSASAHRDRVDALYKTYDMERAKREAEMYKGKGGKYVPYLDKFMPLIPKFK